MFVRVCVCLKALFFMCSYLFVMCKQHDQFLGQEALRCFHSTGQLPGEGSLSNGTYKPAVSVVEIEDSPPRKAFEVQPVAEDTSGLDGMPVTPNDVLMDGETTPPPKHLAWCHSPDSGDKVSPPVEDEEAKWPNWPESQKIGGRFFSRAKWLQSSDGEDADEAIAPTELDSEFESEEEEEEKGKCGNLAAWPFSYSDAEESEEDPIVEPVFEDSYMSVAPVLEDGYCSTFPVEEIQAALCLSSLFGFKGISKVLNLFS